MKFLVSVIGLTLILPGVLCTARAVETPVAIENWSSLQSEVCKLPFKDITNAAKLKESAVLAPIMMNSPVSLLREMTRLSSNAPLQIFGMTCLDAREEKKAAYSAAIEILLFSDKPTSPIFDPVYEYLKIKFDGAVPVLTQLLSAGFRKRESLVMMLMSLPAEDVTAVMTADGFEGWPYLTQATIVDIVFDNGIHQKTPIPELAKKHLARFAGVPGVPRLVYLTYADDGNAEYGKIFSWTIQSEDITDTEAYGLLLSKREYVRMNREKIAQLLNPARALLMKNALKERERSGQSKSE